MTPVPSNGRGVFQHPPCNSNFSRRCPDIGQSRPLSLYLVRLPDSYVPLSPLRTKFTLHLLRSMKGKVYNMIEKTTTFRINNGSLGGTEEHSSCKL